MPWGIAGRRTCRAPPTSTRTGGSRYATARGTRCCSKTWTSGPACASWPARSAGGPTVPLLAAQGAAEPVPAFAEQPDQARGEVAGADQVAGGGDHRWVVRDRVGVAHEPPRHVRAPVAPAPGDHLEVAVLVRREQRELVVVGEPGEHRPERGVGQGAADDLLPGFLLRLGVGDRGAAGGRVARARV